MAIPPWPSSSRLVRQRMFLSAATLQVVGAPDTFARNVPSGPPACGQLATVKGGPVSGAATSPPPRASFGVGTSSSIASVAGAPVSGFGSGPGPDPLSAIGVARPGPLLGVQL